MIRREGSPDLESVVLPAVLAAEGVTVFHRDPRMDGPLAEAEAALRTGHEPGRSLSAVRAMYRRFGIDPTKTRPSSEALLRRLRKGDSLPRINSLVDVVNWCSVETQLPFGLYDRSRIRGPIELRVGREGEEYPGIRKEMIHLRGRPTLADRDGPFGNPTADSARTAVTTATSSVLVVIFAPAGSADAARRALELTEQRVLRFAGGHVVFRGIGFGSAASFDS